MIFLEVKNFLKRAIDEYGNQASYLITGQPDDVKEMKNFFKGKWD